ncbi:hypothetical protein [Tenacibaculum agarivorans]|uniref:hypothetical protein n=1 Tax=Tenacibaculum agarivorans TaxID=1908389 RepID=UPI00094B82C8|nr:hypothetical protein [Tenacibaculum agarivorans]
MKYLQGFILLLLFASGCATNKDLKTSDKYTFERFKSKSGFSSLIIKTYDFEYENDLPGGIICVNKVYHDVLGKGNTMIPLEVKVKPNNNFNVGISYLAKKKIEIPTFFIKEGDSIVIKAYLKDEPIID